MSSCKKHSFLDREVFSLDRCPLMGDPKAQTCVAKQSAIEGVAILANLLGVILGVRSCILMF
jgi:hypothetical protein